jgi:type IV pilus assembly protein PilO
MALQLGFDIKKLNWRNPHKAIRLSVMIVPLVVSIALTVFLVAMPKQQEIEKLDKKIQQQEKDIAKSQSMAAKLEELIAENAKLKLKLKELEAQLPEEREISSLLKQVSDLGLEADLSIQSWKPGVKRNHPSKIVYEVPVNVTIEGSYHRLGQFFSSLTSLDRIVNISTFSLGAPRIVGKEAMMTISFTAVTFTAVEQPVAR